MEPPSAARSFLAPSFQPEPVHRAHNTSKRDRGAEGHMVIMLFPFPIPRVAIDNVQRMHK